MYLKFKKLLILIKILFYLKTLKIHGVRVYNKNKSKM